MQVLTGLLGFFFLRHVSHFLLQVRHFFHQGHETSSDREIAVSFPQLIVIDLYTCTKTCNIINMTLKPIKHHSVTEIKMQWQ